MDIETVKILSEMNERFYAQNAESFSQTRERPWRGWERVVEYLSTLADTRGPVKILDVACGNMRFEAYMRDSGIPISEVVAVDSCGTFCKNLERVHFVERDITKSLVEGSEDPFGCKGERFDAAVCFGFMHHVPSAELRKRLARALVESVVHGGLAFISFWQFMNDERIARKAQPCAAALEGIPSGKFETNDCVLGWKDVMGAMRYCHHFDDSEIDGLCASLGGAAVVRDRYKSDGKKIPLNGYVVLERQ